MLLATLATISALHSSTPTKKFVPIIEFPSVLQIQSEATLTALSDPIMPNHRVVQVESGRVWLSSVGDGTGKTPKYKLVLSTIPLDSSSSLPLGTFDPIPALSPQTISPVNKNARSFEVSIDPQHPLAFSYGFFGDSRASEFLISATLLADGRQSGDITILRVKAFPAPARARVTVGQVPTPVGPGYTPIVRTFGGSEVGQAPSTVSGTVSVVKKLATTEKMPVSFKLSNGPTVYSGFATYSNASANLFIYSFKITVSAPRGTYSSPGTVKIVNAVGTTLESTPLPATVTIK